MMIILLNINSINFYIFIALKFSTTDTFLEIFNLLLAISALITEFVIIYFVIKKLLIFSFVKNLNKKVNSEKINEE